MKKNELNNNKKAYIFKMNLFSANVLALIIMLLLIIMTVLIDINYVISFDNQFFLIFLMIYFCLHEFLHGVGYFIGGGNRDKIKYGICLEKGLLYCMDCEEISKKNILISLQMPFMVIGVITYIVGIIFNIPLLIILSIFNMSGASMDLMMFYYIYRLKDVSYSESGNNDEFVLISKEDLKSKKNLFFNIVNVKEYKKEDYIFDNINKITISKKSIIIMILLVLFSFFM